MMRDSPWLEPLSWAGAWRSSPSTLLPRRAIITSYTPSPLRRIEGRHLGLVERDARRGDVRLEVGYRGGAGDRNDKGRAMQEPGERYLFFGGIVPGCYLRERTARPG